MLTPEYNSTESILDHNTTFFYGVVESISDPSGLMRVKVRIFAVHTDNRKELPTEDLPWALVANSTNNPSTNGIGGNHNLTPGSFVIGYFLDGYECQNPVVLFSLYSKLKQTGQLLYSLSDYQNPGSVFIDKQHSDVIDYFYTGTVPNNVVFKSQSNNLANPLGKDKFYIGNGSNGSGSTLFKDILMEVNGLGEIFKYVELYDVDNIYLTENIDSELSIIPINRVNDIPSFGVVQINNEIITYTDINSQGLVGKVVRGTSFENKTSSKTSHNKFSPVKWLYPIAKNGDNPLLYSTVTKLPLDLAKEIKRKTGIIKGYLVWLTNTISSKLVSYVSDSLYKINSFLSQPTPLLIKNITDSILSIMSQIVCTFGEDTVDSLINKIESDILNQMNVILDNFYNRSNFVLEFVESCSNKIFDLIMQFVGVIDAITILIDGVNNKFPDTFSGSNAIKSKQEFDNSPPELNSKFVDDNNIVTTLLDLLGISCDIKIGERTSVLANDYDGITGECNGIYVYYPVVYKCPPNQDIIASLNGLWSPSPMLVKVYEYGNGIKTEYDTTPGYNRVLHQFSGGSYLEVFNDGSSKTVINNNNYTLVMDDDVLHVKGNCVMKVDGDFNLKVGGNFDLEVMNQYRVMVGGVSQITYTAPHTTNFKSDSKLISTSKLSLTSSKIAIAVSGGVDCTGGVFNVLTNEINLTSTGSLNLLSSYRNDITALNSNIVDNGSKSVIVSRDEKKLNLGNYTKDTVGVYQHNCVSTRTMNVGSINTENSGTKIESVKSLYQTNAQLKITNCNLNVLTVDGANIQQAKGISLRTTDGLNIDA